jgi:hypothetical protein
LFSKNYPHILKAKHFEHSIWLEYNKPRFQKQYPVPDAHRPSIEMQIQEWLKIGSFQPSQFRDNSPMFMAPKKGLLS